MSNLELKKGLNLAERILRAIFPGCEVTFAESFTDMGWNFYVKHGMGPLETITVRLSCEILEDEDGQEILERRIRDADLPAFAARYPRGTVKIDWTGTRVIDTGQA